MSQMVADSLPLYSANLPALTASFANVGVPTTMRQLAEEDLEGVAGGGVIGAILGTLAGAALGGCTAFKLSKGDIGYTAMGVVAGGLTGGAIGGTITGPI